MILKARLVRQGLVAGCLNGVEVVIYNRE